MIVLEKLQDHIERCARIPRYVPAHQERAELESKLSQLRKEERELIAVVFARSRPLTIKEIKEGMTDE